MSTGYFGRAVPLALRGFSKLQCSRWTAERTTESFLLPSSLPSGTHVVLLLNRRRQIEYCDSWLSVREAWERVLTDRGLHQKGEMQMYMCCMLPRFWLFRPMWYLRMRQWQDLLQQDEEPSVHLLSCTSWSDFHENMQIHNDGRSYGLIIRNDGEILWASDDAFKAHLQEKDMVRVVNKECTWRADEMQKLLQDPTAGGRLEGSSSSTPNYAAEETHAAASLAKEGSAPDAPTETTKEGSEPSRTSAAGGA